MATYDMPERANDDSIISEIAALRVQVWKDEGVCETSDFEDGQWRDEFDSSSEHWIVRENGRVVAASRLTVCEAHPEMLYGEYFQKHRVPLLGKVALLSRLVVEKDFQGEGIGSCLIDEQIKFAKATGADTFAVVAVEGLASNFARRGFLHSGDIELPEYAPKSRYCYLWKSLS